MTPEHVGPIVPERCRCPVGQFGEPRLETLDIRRRHRLGRAGTVEQALHDRPAAQQLDGDVDVGLDLALGTVPPRLGMVRPADHLELVTAELGRRERGVPPIVDVVPHRRLGPLATATGRRDGAPPDSGIDGIVSVAEHICDHGDGFTERRLGGVPTTIDQGSDGFDDHS